MKSKLIRKRAWIVAAVFVLLAFCGAEVAHRTIVAPKYEALNVEKMNAPVSTLDGMYQISLNLKDGITVVGYNGQRFYFENATVPSEISENPIDRIGYCAFCDCYNLKTITILPGLKQIDGEAIVRCEDLEELYIPASVQKIEKNSIEDCGEFTIFAELGSYAERFANENGIPCKSYTPTLTESVVGDTSKVTFDQRYEDGTCSAYYSIVLYEGEPVCALTHVNFGSKALYDSVTIPSEIDGVPVTVLSTQAMGMQLPVYKLVLPESLRIIGNRAFVDCGNMQEITMGGSVLYIGDEAFKGCYSRMVIHVPAGSYAEQYAKKQGMTCENDSNAANSMERR